MMRTMLVVLDCPLAHRIGWALLHSLWQGALIGLVFALVNQALRGRSANVRYLFACFALALLLLAPVVTFCFSLSDPASPTSGPALPAMASTFSHESPPVLAHAEPSFPAA